MPPPGAAVGLDLPRARRGPARRVVELHRAARHVARRARVHAQAQRGHQHHRLERGAGLAVALRGEVELRLAVLPARRPSRRCRRWPGRSRRSPRRGRCRRAVGDRGARLLLLLEVDRRVDLEAAALDVLAAVLLDQLGLDVVEDVALARLLEVALHVQPEVLLHLGLRRLTRDVAELGHLAQHLVAARLGPARVEHRRILGRRLRHAGEHRRLAQRQVLDALVEVQPRGGAGADRGLAADRAVGHRVEVLAEDPRLRSTASSRSRASLASLILRS